MAKKTPPAPSRIVLTQDQLAAIAQRQNIIGYYQHVLSCLETERDALIHSLTGVNVRAEAWNLDMQQGVLERAGSN